MRGVADAKTINGECAISSSEGIVDIAVVVVVVIQIPVAALPIRSLLGTRTQKILTFCQNQYRVLEVG
jgi:hypothetical protein